MTGNEVLSLLVSLSKSQGSYGRFLHNLIVTDSIRDFVEWADGYGFKDALDVIRWFEE